MKCETCGGDDFDSALVCVACNGNVIEAISEAKLALAAREAEVLALRRALSEALGDGHNLKAFAGTMLRWGQPGVDVSDEARRVVEHAEKWHRIIAAALAAPTSTEALRGLLLTAANMGYQDGEAGSARSPAEVVSAVLEEEKPA